jgi:hypothetical protein
LVNCRAFGIESEFITPLEAGEKWPNIRTDDILVSTKSKKENSVKTTYGLVTTVLPHQYCVSCASYQLVFVAKSRLDLSSFLRSYCCK